MSLPRANAYEDFLALSAPTARNNADYATPFDTAARTGSRYPTIVTAGGQHFVQPTAITARAFCERIYAMMRNADDPDIENKYGKALKATVVRVLEDAGDTPTVVGEEYLSDRKGWAGEADVVLKTEERVFLIECKKKPLTTAARGGSTLAAARPRRELLQARPAAERARGATARPGRHHVRQRSEGRAAGSAGREDRGRPVRPWIPAGQGLHDRPRQGPGQGEPRLGPTRGGSHHGLHQQAPRQDQ